MIYTKVSGTQTLRFPRNVAELPAGTYRLILLSTVMRSEVDVPIANVNESMLALNAEVTLPDLTQGEYEYELYKGGTIISTGLLIVEYELEIKGYNKNMTYVEYEE